MLLIGTSLVEPAFVIHGTRQIHGSRMPPSYIQPLPPRSGRLLVGIPSLVDRPPLSDVNTTIVFSVSPSSSSLSSTAPTASSIASTIAA